MKTTASPTTVYTVPLSSIEAPSTTIAVFDNLIITTDNSSKPFSAIFLDVGAALNLSNAEGVDNLANGTNTIGRMAARHLETTNVLYADGHVKAIKLDAVIKDTVAAKSSGGTNFTAYSALTNADD